MKKKWRMPFWMFVFSIYLHTKANQIHEWLSHSFTDDSTYTLDVFWIPVAEIERYNTIQWKNALFVIAFTLLISAIHLTFQRMGSAVRKHHQRRTWKQKRIQPVPPWQRKAI